MRVSNGQPTRRDLLRLLAASLAGQAGCGFTGYSIRPPYDLTVKTVYVPMFRSFSFRREIQQQLTELVIKEIEKRTPYKVVGNIEEADTILEGSVGYTDKNIIVESPFNLPRQLTATVQCQVSWISNPPKEYEKNRPPTLIAETVNFYPEVGETTETAYYRVCQNLATQIVDMMETPWAATRD